MFFLAGQLHQTRYPYHCGSMLRVNCGLRGVDRTLGSLSLIQWRVLSLATREETSLHRCTLIRSLSIFVLSRASFSFWEPFLHRIAFDFGCFGMLVVCPSSHGLAQVGGYIGLVISTSHDIATSSVHLTNLAFSSDAFSSNRKYVAKL